MRTQLIIVLLLLLLAGMNTLWVNSGVSPVPYYVPSSIKLVIFYYGWLDTSNVEQTSPDILVFSGVTGSDYIHNRVVVQNMESKGVEVYAYIHDGATPVGLGTTFKSMVVDEDSSCPSSLVSSWVSYIEGVIDNVTQTYPNTNIFLDEADPAYFGTTDPHNECVIAFTNGISEIVDYVHSKNLKVMLNGVRAYSPLADYYLWEDFYQLYNKTYILDTKFFSENDNGNPYLWENGYGKYVWLRDHGQLNKTIALSFLPPDSIKNNIASYILATGLGLGGWSVAPIDIYASGGFVYQPRSLPIGGLIDNTTINVTSGLVEFNTIYGKYSINVTSGTYTVPVELSGIDFTPYIDGYKDNVYTSLDITASGSSSEISDVYYTIGGDTLYLFINGTWTGSQVSVLYHIYIDNDTNIDTGFTGTNLNVGADILIEIYSDSSAAEVFKYTGSGGTDWSWSLVREVPVYVTQETSTTAEVEIPLSLISDNATLQVTTVDSSFSDDAVSSVIDVSTLQVNENLYPLLMMNPEPYNGTIPILTSIEKGPNEITVTIYRHSGYATYMFLVPFSKVGSVIKNGNVALPENSGSEYWEVLGTSNGYTEVLVRVLHASPVTISIYQAPPANAGSSLGGDSRSMSSLVWIVIVGLVVTAVWIRRVS